MRGTSVILNDDRIQERNDLIARLIPDPKDDGDYDKEGITTGDIIGHQGEGNLKDVIIDFCFKGLLKYDGRVVETTELGIAVYKIAFVSAKRTEEVFEEILCGKISNILRLDNEDFCTVYKVLHRFKLVPRDYSLLNLCIYRKRITCIKKILEMGNCEGGLLVHNPLVEYPLCIVACESDDIFDFLMEYEWEWRTPNAEGVDAFAHAAARGDKYKMHRLYNKGADPNSTDYGGFTPIMRAREDKNEEIIELLMNMGVDTY